MRYSTIENISFETKTGKSLEIKDMREYPNYTLLGMLKITTEDQIDEIASREEIYGDEGEALSFKIVDFNIIKLFEENFELEKLNVLKIPV